MRLFVTGIVSALAALASAYTDPDYSQDPSGNAILKPGLAELVPAGKLYTVTWEPTTKGPVSLVLLRGPSTNVKPHGVIAESVANTGKYVWDVPATLEPDTTHYGILLVVEGTGQYQYSTQFGISNPNYEGGGDGPSESSPAATPTPTATATETTTSTTKTITPTTTTEESTTIKPEPTTTKTQEPEPTATITTTTEAPVETTTSVTPPRPTTTQTTTLQSSPVASQTPSNTPTQPPPTGAAPRHAFNMGAVALGMAAVLAF